MPTKAELELAIEDLKNEVLDLQEQKGNHVEENRRLQEQASNTDQLLKGLTLWSAFNSPGAPLCVSSGGGYGDPEFTLAIYANEGELEGVVIGDLDGRVSFAAGKIPAGAVLEALGLKAI